LVATAGQRLSDEQLRDLLALVDSADSVELKLFGEGVVARARRVQKRALQQTKTRKALRFFARQAAEQPPSGQG
jgi:hypothetical protein